MAHVPNALSRPARYQASEHAPACQARLLPAEVHPALAAQAGAVLLVLALAARCWLLPWAAHRCRPLVVVVRYLRRVHRPGRQRVDLHPAVAPLARGAVQTRRRTRLLTQHTSLYVRCERRCPVLYRAVSVYALKGWDPIV